MQAVIETVTTPRQDFDHTSFIDLVGGLSKEEIIAIVPLLPSIPTLRKKYNPLLEPHDKPPNANKTREALKISEYKMHIILWLSIGYVQCNHTDPLPDDVILKITTLLQDISFLVDPLHNGAATFMERVLVENFSDQMPRTLRDIYSYLEIPKPKKLKEYFANYKISKSNGTQALPLVDEETIIGTPTPKRRKVANEATANIADKNEGTNDSIFSSVLKQYMCTQIPQKSLNHFSSGLCDIKSLFGKQTVVVEPRTPPQKKVVHKSRPQKHSSGNDKN
jgi:hypothetical protein